MDTKRAIRKKFRIKPHDNLPFRAWNGGRNVLAEFFGEVGFKVGAEIGVCKACYSKILFAKIPELKLYCVDPWGAYNRVSIERANLRYDIAMGILNGKNAEIKRMESYKAAVDIPNGSLDFVYIDGKHEFDWAMMDLILWSAKVKTGGVVAVHDYYHFYSSGVVQAVNTYTHCHNIFEWYITKEGNPTAFWVKAEEHPHRVFKV